MSLPPARLAFLTPTSVLFALNTLHIDTGDTHRCISSHDQVYRAIHTTHLTLEASPTMHDSLTRTRACSCAFAVAIASRGEILSSAVERQRHIPGLVAKRVGGQLFG